MSQKGISQSFIWLRIKIKWGVRDKNVWISLVADL